MTQTHAPRPAPRTRHGVCQWAHLLKPGVYELAHGWAWLWVTVENKAGKVTALYRVHLHHSAAGALEGVTMTKCADHGPDTDVQYTIDCSFGPVPEEHWACDCPDCEYTRPVGGCKHVRAAAAALRKINVL